MPNFHLTEKEIEELSHYLFNQSVPWELAQQHPVGRGGAARQRGQRQEALLRIALHLLPHGRRQGQRLGPGALEGRLVRDARLAARVPARSAGLLSANEDAALPLLGDRIARRRRLHGRRAARLRRSEGDPRRRSASIRRSPRTGRSSSGRAGCFACHSEPSGSEEKFGPELNGIGDKKASSLDFGRRTDLPRTLPAWLAAKIDSPRSFAQGLQNALLRIQRAKTRGAVVTALLSLASQPVPEPYRFAPPRVAALVPGGPVGALIDRYRCLSCHQIGEEGGDISTAPLDLRGEQGPARLADRLPDALLLAAPDSRGADAGLAHAAGRGDPARRRLRELLPRSDGSRRIPSPAGRRPTPTRRRDRGST